MLRTVRSLLACLFISLSISCSSEQQQTADTTSPISDVKITGAMRNVMHKGELAGTITLDTISKKAGLYGLGPVEYLRGELLILDGKSYVATVQADSSMKVVENFAVKAPFFVYANQQAWNTVALPESVQTLQKLETFMNKVAAQMTAPFVFKLSGRIEQAVIHVQNLPAGTTVSSPAEAHQGQVNYPLSGQAVDILGFYSTKHKGVFTHHDSNMHLHLITTDRQQMGHLDELDFKPGGMKLFLPVKR